MKPRASSTPMMPPAKALGTPVLRLASAAPSDCGSAKLRVSVSEPAGPPSCTSTARSTCSAPAAAGKQSTCARYTLPPTSGMFFWQKPKPIPARRKSRWMSSIDRNRPCWLLCTWGWVAKMGRVVGQTADAANTTIELASIEIMTSTIVKPRFALRRTLHPQVDLANAAAGLVPEDRHAQELHAIAQDRHLAVAHVRRACAGAAGKGGAGGEHRLLRRSAGRAGRAHQRERLRHGLVDHLLAHTA